jgi:NADH-quinone oxidoreductase subunit D
MPAEPPRRISVTVGAGAFAGGSRDGSDGGSGDAELVLDLGADHPSTHGGLRLSLTLDGERITSADPRIGFVHRGAEKLFEVRDYRQILMLANRHDWLSAFANELGVVLAVERLMGLTVPPRAVRLRTALAEINRASAGLAFLGAVPADDGGAVVRTTAEREALLGVLEEVSGGRVHTMFNRIGGLKEDVPAGWIGRTRDVLEQLAGSVPPLTDRLLGSPEVRRAAGQGVVTQDMVDGYGLSGPVARAAGVALDLRRDEPYLAYPDLELPYPPDGDSAGDVPARFACLAGDVLAGLQLARTCLADLPSGPIAVRLPKAVRAPEGETYAWTENPFGITGYHLVSRGGTTPWRLKVRTPSFATLSALPEILPGLALPDLPMVLASLFFVLGDADR